MTDRHNAYIVILDGPIREDDAEAIRTALMMVKRVIKVETLPEDGYSVIVARAQVKNDIRKQFDDLYNSI